MTGLPPDTHALTKAERRALRLRVGEYHEREQRVLIERLRERLAELDAGAIAPFDFDETVHHYHRASQKLWAFCCGGASHVEGAARQLEWAEQEGEQFDWWAIGAPRRGR